MRQHSVRTPPPLKFRTLKTPALRGAAILASSLPQAPRAWSANRRLQARWTTSFSSSNLASVNTDTATAYWAAENDRLALLVTKSTGVLAVASLTVAPAVQVASAGDAPRALALLAGAYLLSAVLSGVAVNLPRPRVTLTLHEAASEKAAALMLDAAADNELEGIKLSNWVSAGIRDCIAAIMLLLTGFFTGSIL